MRFEESVVGSKLESTDASGLEGGIVRAVRREVAEEVWTWYAEHKDMVLASAGVLFFKVTIRVRDVRGLLELLVGDPPAELAL